MSEDKEKCDHDIQSTNQYGLICFKCERQFDDHEITVKEEYK